MIDKTTTTSIIPIKPSAATLKNTTDKMPSYDRRRSPRDDEESSKEKKQRRGRHVDERC